MSASVLIWIWLCALLNCAGWALSGIGELNVAGYVIVLSLGISAVGFWKGREALDILKSVHWRKFRCRFRRAFPLMFLILLAMAFLGGAIYPPGNWDALTYRLPRILHWMAANHWHWVHTLLPRLNDRSCGIEWVSAPLIVLGKTDRLLFVINIISFLFLPGLVFSVFTRLGVSPRTAWHWMWIVPTAYGFVVQAGSIGNDLFGAVFALSAVDFALRAKASKATIEFFTSVIAAGLMTSAKIGNLPLLLPWAIAVLPSAKLLLIRPARSLFVCIIGLLASALPTMVFNQIYAEDWSGIGIGLNSTSNKAIATREMGRFVANQDSLTNTHRHHEIALRLGANAVLFALQNLVPPFFPWYDKWNHFTEHVLPLGLKMKLAELIEWPDCEFHLDGIQFEDNAGLGLGVSALLCGSVATVMLVRRKSSAIGFSVWQTCVRWSPVVALIAVFAESNLSTIARLLNPYYALLLPSLLSGSGHEQLVRTRCWRAAAFVVFLFAAGLVVVSPTRPLFPLQIFKELEARFADSKALTEIDKNYSLFRERPSTFSIVVPLLPASLKVLGVTTYNDPLASLWRPYGSRRIEEVCPEDTATALKTRGVQYILIRSDLFGKWFSAPIDDWMQKMNAKIVHPSPIKIRVSGGHASSIPCDWYLVELL